MKLPKILTAFAATAILLATGAGVTAEQQGSFFEGVDWKNKVVTVTGEGIVPPGSVNYTQAKGMASKAARADAYRKIGELVNGVRVEGETTVENMLTTKDTVKMRVDATIKGAKILNETFLSDGGYRVTVQVPLFGVSNSLAGAVFERNSTVEPFADPVVEVAPSVQQYDSSTPVKRRIEVTSQSKVTVEEYVPSTPVPTTPAPTTPYRSPLTRMSVSTLGNADLQKLQADSLTISEPIYQPTAYANSQVSYETPATVQSQMKKKTVAEYASMAEGDYTGLIVDCRGLGLEPVMSPVIKNINGTKIYGHKNLDIDRVIREGMADYSSDVDNVSRAGDNPIVVKAVSLDNFNSNPVVAIPDSNRILIENHATQFLKDLRVVFLFD
ncbi:MAG: LPP20 family lipoprotein [Selenomonadaceae bacterium]|nr:LPP20 family lipoprotein [Selenomonadaceae bacterium]